MNSIMNIKHVLNTSEKKKNYKLLKINIDSKRN